MDYHHLFDRLKQAGFDVWVEDLQQQSADWMIHHGDYSRWNNALFSLPDIDQACLEFLSPAVTIKGECAEQQNLMNALQGLKPWRKGPFQFGDVYIDTEWRSNLKWARVAPHLAQLKGRKILDIGAGNGYYSWKMLEHNPELVVAIEPSVLFNFQFMAVQKYLSAPNLTMLPIGIEKLPETMNWFDTVFSMGVLYHRRSPIDHLMHIRGLLNSGGQICLETLVINGDINDVLVPQDRYARMRNVWFLPSVPALENWLRRCGYKNIRTVDVSATTIEEQRSTEWMQFESLSECLHSSNPEMTVEGLPAPLRATILAEKP